MKTITEFRAWWLRITNPKKRTKLLFDEKFSLFFPVCFPDTKEYYIYIGKGYFLPQKRVRPARTFLSITI